jgi:flavin-dependent dehydrogenase
MVEVAIVRGGPAGSNCAFSVRVAGRDWILIGDANGYVDSVLGDGIVHALLDGELAAQAVVENDCRLFNRLWKEASGFRAIPRH